MSDDFTHRLRLDQVRDGERIELVADEKERAAIAQRLDIEKLDRLEAHAALSRIGDVIRARGRVAASLDQRCVVTGDPVAAHIDEAFEIAFVPAPEPTAEEEIELGAADCDTIFHDGSGIELGAAIADTLALALDPYPRSAGAEAALKEAGVLSEEQAGPFAVLAQLKKDLGGSEN